MGKVKSGTVCSVRGCDQKATRSVAANKARNALQSAGVVVDNTRMRRMYLCQKHYKVLKKKTKKEKKVDKWRYGI